MYQTEKQIVDGNKECDGRHDVVCLTTMDNRAGLIENQTGHQDDEHTGNRNRQHRQIENYCAERQRNAARIPANSIPPKNAKFFLVVSA